MSVAWTAYRMLAPVFGAAAPAGRLLARPDQRARWSERLGRIEARPPADAWIHSASLGEALASSALVRALEAAAPQARFHLTANTLTGRSRLIELGYSCTLAPLDAPQTVSRFFATVAPRRLLLIETELWPHWLIRARAARIPVAVVSGRLSPRSLERYARLGDSFRSLIGGLAAVLCQSAAARERWVALGTHGERTVVTGNLKDDALAEPPAEPERDRRRARLALGFDPDRPLLVLGSLRPGEMSHVAASWQALPEPIRARWHVVAVPRHPHAAAGLRAEAARAGQALCEPGAPVEGAWCWDERVGVLAGYYAAADVAVVGGSFAPHGGHNPLEPAACGAPVIVGPHHATQEEGVRALVAAGGGRVARTGAELTGALSLWLGDEAARATAGDAALAVVRGRRGAARRSVTQLVEWGLWPPA